MDSPARHWFAIRLDPPHTGLTTEEAASALVDIARGFQISVVCCVNETDMLAYPREDTGRDVLGRWLAARGKDPMNLRPDKERVGAPAAPIPEVFRPSETALSYLRQLLDPPLGWNSDRSAFRRVVEELSRDGTEVPPEKILTGGDGDYLAFCGRHGGVHWRSEQEVSTATCNRTK